MMIMIGAVIGAVLRFAVYDFSQKLTASYVPTIVVNVIGSFCLGIYSQYFNDNYYDFFVIGLLSSFTTFSTFSVDAVKLFNEKKWLGAVGYIAVNIVLCAIALVVGLAI